MSIINVEEFEGTIQITTSPMFGVNVIFDREEEGFAIVRDPNGSKWTIAPHNIVIEIIQNGNDFTLLCEQSLDDEIISSYRENISETLKNYLKMILDSDVAIDGPAEEEEPIGNPITDIVQEANFIIFKTSPNNGFSVLFNGIEGVVETEVDKSWTFPNGTNIYISPVDGDGNHMLHVYTVDEENTSVMSFTEIITTDMRLRLVNMLRGIVGGRRRKNKSRRRQKKRGTRKSKKSRRSH